MELEEIINKRKSIRKYSNEPVSIQEVEKLVQVGMKTPCAGGIHSLQIYQVWDENIKKELCKAALGQRCVEEAPVCLVIATNNRTVERYHGRGIRYIHMEAGHAGQNISLMATSMGLGCVMIGAFRDEEVKKVLGLKDDPLYIIPVGKML